MKLSYRGHAYEAHTASLEEQGTEEIGIYRGHKLSRKVFRLPQQPHEKVELTYRGVRYSQDV